MNAFVGGSLCECETTNCNGKENFGLGRAVVRFTTCVLGSAIFGELVEEVVESIHDNQSDTEDNRRCNNYEEPTIITG